MSSSSSSQSHFPHQRPPNRLSSNSSSASSSWGHKHWGGSIEEPMDMRFTPEMRDRQARGKDPYLPESAAESSNFGGGNNSRGHRTAGAGARSAGASRQQPKEPFQKTERRDWAEAVLDNPELLLMYAQSSGDTLPATRLKFKKIMCGLEDDESDDASSGSDMSRGGGNQYQGHHHHQQQQQRYGGGSRREGGGTSGGGGGARGGRR